ncbi:MAG TPA: bifunctional diaminohydroxyphosphoribosylaminopyrimidine deaminase/5-amino-6-(5-phosphoribosylamino)uracil reductase RibD [Jatrophihabitans sp.]
MRQALILGASVRGRTSPNPPVGAVVLAADGTLAGEGATQPVGGPHAEIVALARAGGAARGGTAIVTLEPCNHIGRTGPCTEALIGAGIARVLYAVDDPNPAAAGGVERLTEAGIEVVGSVLENEARHGALRPWLHAIETGRPFVTWKFAATLDGRIAAADLTSKWISSAASRADSHQLRDIVDAILVGSGTVLADDPQLTVRGPDDELAERQPLRVVLDRRRRVTKFQQQYRVFDSSAETLALDTAVPRFALKALYDRGVHHILLEGGPTLAGAFVEAGVVDEFVAYLAPKLLGEGPSALGHAGIHTIADALTLEVGSVSTIGDDVKLVGYPRRTETTDE